MDYVVKTTLQLPSFYNITLHPRRGVKRFVKDRLDMSRKTLRTLGGDGGDVVCREPGDLREKELSTPELWV